MSPRHDLGHQWQKASTQSLSFARSFHLIERYRKRFYQEFVTRVRRASAADLRTEPDLEGLKATIDASLARLPDDAYYSGMSGVPRHDLPWLGIEVSPPLPRTRGDDDGGASDLLLVVGSRTHRALHGFIACLLALCGNVRVCF